MNTAKCHEANAPISSVCTAFPEVVTKSESYRSMNIQDQRLQGLAQSDSVRCTMDEENINHHDVELCANG
ncbi:hypothetical protein BOTNAR_0393g00090 [Botryotinia narcissicola]|uniref:Uncharacterized protein n=1 Tax=Botryotinia narcissicola TaxID=278944 RepID=A0A4Z1HNZ1_9HELO|nr:hypothetical protein BOTNAR_0393g00090 [Botryotinia narcissicola]